MGATLLATLASFRRSALALATTALLLWKASPLTFLLASRAATMSWYFHPTSWPSLPREQYFLPLFSLRTFRAEGMTIFFFLSYGGGTPSKVCRRLRASLPLSVLCGVMPRTVLQKIFEGALKWKAPRLGLTLHLFLRKSRYFSLLR